MKSSVSAFKAGHKVLSIEPLHVDLSKVLGKGKKAILIPVEDLTIGQNFTPSYASAPAYGRMDPIVTYKNTQRTMTFKFKCQAHHIFDKPEGVVNNIRNVNLLTQLMYPTYQNLGRTDSNGDPYAVLGAPPFFRIKYGNYVGSFSPLGKITPSEGAGAAGLTGYIDKFTHTLGTKIATNVAFGKSGKDKTFRALPREITVDFSFKVIHDKLVGWYNGKFSPNGYGHNFPYNAGEFKAQDEKPQTPGGTGATGANATKPSGKIADAKANKALSAGNAGWSLDYFRKK